MRSLKLTALLLCLTGALWADVGSVSTPPGGSNGSVQFNGNRRMSGDTEFTYSTQTKRLTVPGVVTSTMILNGVEYRFPASCPGGTFWRYDGLNITCEAPTSFAVSTGTALAIKDGAVNISSPTSAIDFNGTQFVVTLVGDTTASIQLNTSSVTVLGPTIELNGPEVTGSLPAASISAGTLGASVVASSIGINAVTDGSIVSVSGSKVTGNIPGNAAGITGTVNASQIIGLTTSTLRVQSSAGVLLSSLTTTISYDTATINAAGLGGGTTFYFGVKPDLTISTLTISDFPQNTPLYFNAGGYLDARAIRLDTPDVTGVLPVVNGGTGESLYDDGELMVGNGDTGGLTKTTLTAGSGVTITNSPGAIEISASGSSDILNSTQTWTGTNTFNTFPLIPAFRDTNKGVLFSSASLSSGVAESTEVYLNTTGGGTAAGISYNGQAKMTIEQNDAGSAYGLSVKNTVANGIGGIFAAFGTNGIALKSIGKSVFESSNTANSISVIHRGTPSSLQSDTGGAVNITVVNSLAPNLVLVSSYPDVQKGTAMMELYQNSPDFNDPLIRIFNTSHESNPFLRVDDPAPDLEVVNTSTDGAHGLGKAEPFAMAYQGIDLQINFRAYDNSTFENLVRIHPQHTGVPNDTEAPGIYLAAQNSDEDVIVVPSSGTSSFCATTLNGRTRCITAPPNAPNTWTEALPDNLPITGSVMYHGGTVANGSRTVRQMRWTAADWTYSPTTGVSISTATVASITMSTATLSGVTFATLGAAANGNIKYCSDCTVTTAATCTAAAIANCVCAGSGSGAFARRLNGAWYCH